MKRIITLLLLCVLSAVASAQALTSKGNVFATWTNPNRISPGSDAIVHAGDAITVSVGGQVDINQDTRHERHCDLWVFCHDETIPIHNFRSPGQVGIIVEIRPVGGGTTVASSVVGNTPVVLQLPPSDPTFEIQYEIVALLAGANTVIAPGRSGGSYDVRLDVDASGRAAYFRSWLNQAQPTAARATGSDVIGDDIRTQGNIVATALRQYAINVFPVPSAANSESHAKLIRKAVELAPGDLENTLALAKYLRIIGLDTQADAELTKAVSQLEALTDPHSRRLLGDAYMARMSAALSKGGGVDGSAAQAALSFADNAARAYGQAERPDLVSEANYNRGRILRGMRTRESLTAANDAFTNALTGVPDTLAADSILQASGGKVFALKITDSIRLSSIVTGSTSSDPVFTDTPLAWDPGSQLLLAHGSGGLSWFSPQLNLSKAAPAVSPGFGFVGAGAIVRVKDGQVVDYFSADQRATSLQVGGANVTTCVSPAGGATPGIQAVTLSMDGTTAAVICNNTLRVFHQTDGTISQTLEKTLPAAVPFETKFVVAGPVSCGTVLIYGPYPGHSATSLSLLRSGSDVKLTDIPSPETGGANVIGPDQVTFAEDRVLVASANKQISRYRCSDGTTDTPIELQAAANWPFAQISFRWLTTSSLVAVRAWAKSFDVITLPGRNIAHYEASADLSSSDLQNAESILIPGSRSSDPPRFLKQFRRAEITEQVSSGKASATNVDIPGAWENLVVTSDGSHFLLQRAGSPTWIADAKSTPTIVEGSRNEIALDIIGNGSKWIATNGNGGDLNSLRIADANGNDSNIPLPIAPDTYFKKVTTTLQAEYAVWKQLPTGPEVPGTFHNRDLPDVIADPSLLALSYRVQSAPLLSPPPNSYGLSLYSVVLPALAAAPGRAAFTVCGVAFAKATTTSKPLPIAQQVPDLLFLGVESSSDISFQLVPDPIAPPAPPAIAPSVCPFGQLVRGASPTLLLQYASPPVSKWKMLSQSGWVNVDMTDTPVAGWTTADGGMLILVQLIAAANQQPKYSLNRIKPDGSITPACVRCSNLPLSEAFKTLMPTTPTPTVAQRRFAAGGPASMIMIDPQGKYLALPNDDELLVIAISDGKILRHTPLGKPMMLSDHVVMISAGDKRMRSYSF